MTMRLRSCIYKKWFSILLLILIGGSLYLPNMSELGYYRDDWNNLFNADSRGTEMLIEHYASDRPADGYLLSAAYRAFGADPFPYRVVNLASRVLAAIFFSLSCAAIWRRPPFAAFAAGALFLVFPGYLRQVDGITYLPHQVAMAAMAGSIYLSIAALDAKRAVARVGFAVSAAALAVASMFLMEYYIGMEALRFCLLWAYDANRRERTFFAGFGRALLLFVPYILSAIFFFYWRSFIFEATRSGTDVMPILLTFRKAPKYVGAAWIQKSGMNLFKLLVGSWAVPPYHVLNGVELRLFFHALAQALIPLGVFCAAFLGLTRERKTGALPARSEAGAEPAANGKLRWQQQWILIGILSAAAEVFLLVVATREITFSSSLDRFTYPGAFSAVMTLIGFAALIEGRMVKFVLLTGVVLMSVLTQRVTQLRYAAQTEIENDFWWQLSWRAPDIQDGTMVLLHNAGFAPEEDYENFGPLHLIYRRRQGNILIASDLLNLESVRKVQMGTVDERMVRKIYLLQDYSKVLAVTKPTAKSCVQVIDGRNPIYSPFDSSRIAAVGFASEPDRILLDGAARYPDPALFGAEPAREWCYSYAQMSVAQQKQDWAGAARIADAAIAAGYHSEDPVEWIPVVQAFAYQGRLDEETRGYLAILKTVPYLRYESCAYFRRAGELLDLNETERAGNTFLMTELCEDDRASE